jgi:hypothetical protein
MTTSRVSNALWAQIANLSGQRLVTPANRSDFEVQAVSLTHVSVAAGISTVSVSRQAFEQTLDYLITRGHQGPINHVAIGSNKDPLLASPLCQAARREPDGTSGRMVITYVLPILEACGAVGIGRTARPSTVWLLP